MHLKLILNLVIGVVKNKNFNKIIKNLKTMYIKGIRYFNSNYVI